MESFPFPGSSSSPQTRLGGFSDLFLPALTETPQIPFAPFIIFFPQQSPFQNTEIYILKNINTSHCDWIHDCFAQPPAGKASSLTCSRNDLSALWNSSWQNSSQFFPSVLPFIKGGRRRKTFGGWHMGTILQGGPRPAQQRPQIDSFLSKSAPGAFP